MQAGAGALRNGNRGGQGGKSVFELTLEQNQEYILDLVLKFNLPVQTVGVVPHISIKKQDSSLPLVEAVVPELMEEVEMVEELELQVKHLRVQMELEDPPLILEHCQQQEYSLVVL